MGSTDAKRNLLRKGEKLNCCETINGITPINMDRETKQYSRRDASDAGATSCETTGQGYLRVFICGAHSTGKTTLLQDVAKRVQITAVPEVARQLIKDLDVRDYIDWKNHPDKFEELQLMILKKQCQVEKQHENTDYVTDRGIDPLVYAKTFLDDEAYGRLLQSEEAQNSIHRYRQGNCLLFVIQPQKECVHDDGFRMTPKWNEMCQFHDVMIDVLTSLRIRHYVIDFLNRTDRAEFVVDKIRQVKVSLACDDKLDS